MRALLAVMSVFACNTEPRRATVIDTPIDTYAAACPVLRPFDVCNVLTQSGCYVDEQCTWIEDAPEIGHIGCVPDGTAFIGSACTYGPPNSGTCRYDNCVKGAICVDTVCRKICDQAGGLPECGSGFGCKTYDGLFGPRGMTVAAGACVPRCSPLDDNDFLGSGSKPGSACTEQQGCYWLPDTQPSPEAPTIWTCERELHPTLVHRSPIAAQTENGCAQGYEPVYLDSDGSTQIDCIAECAPLDCYAGNCGSNSANLGGAEPHACNGSDARGAFNVATAANNGDQCMYSWVAEIDPGGNHIPSPTSNTVGFCIDHSKYGMPSCDTLPLGSGSQDAPAFGCVSTSLAGLPRRTTLRFPYLQGDHRLRALP